MSGVSCPEPQTNNVSTVSGRVATSSVGFHDPSQVYVPETPGHSSELLVPREQCDYDDDDDYDDAFFRRTHGSRLSPVVSDCENSPVISYAADSNAAACTPPPPLAVDALYHASPFRVSVCIVAV